MYNLRVIRMVFLRAYWNFSSYRNLLWLSIISSTFFLLQMAMLGYFVQQGHPIGDRDLYGGNMISFMVSGSLFSSVLAVGLQNMGQSIRGEQENGTLEALVLSRINLLWLVLATSSIDVLSNLATAALSFGLINLIFSLHLQIQVFPLLVTLGLFTAIMLAIGLISAGLLIQIKRGDPVTWVVSTVTGLLSGVLFPVSLLPAWLAKFSEFLPTTRALHALRLSFYSATSPEQYLASWACLTVWLLALLPISLLVFQRNLRLARREGNLAEY